MIRNQSPFDSVVAAQILGEAHAEAIATATLPAARNSLANTTCLDAIISSPEFVELVADGRAGRKIHPARFWVIGSPAVERMALAYAAGRDLVTLRIQFPGGMEDGFLFLERRGNLWRRRDVGDIQRWLYWKHPRANEMPPRWRRAAALRVMDSNRVSLPAWWSPAQAFADLGGFCEIPVSRLATLGLEMSARIDGGERRSPLDEAAA